MPRRRKVDAKSIPSDLDRLRIMREALIEIHRYCLTVRDSKVLARNALDQAYP